MRYPFVLIDADDTLFDFAHAEKQALVYALQSNNQPVLEGAYPFFHAKNERYWQLYQKGEIAREELRTARFLSLAKQFSLENVQVNRLAEAFLQGIAEGSRLLPGALAFLQEVTAQGARLALITNGVGFVQRRRLLLAGIESYFEAIFISEESGAPKPAPDMLFAALSHFPCPDKRLALMVGDNPESDIQAARNAGVDSCWFNPTGNVSLVKATHQAANFAALKEIIC